MEKIKEKESTFIDYFDAIAISVAITVMIFQFVTHSYFAVLSLFFLAFYSVVFILLKRKKTFLNIILVLLMLFRYFFITVLYDTKIVFTNTGFQYQTIEDFAPVTGVYIGEMIGIFGAIFIYPYLKTIVKRIFGKYISNNNILQDNTSHNSNILYLCFGLIALAILLIYRGIIPFNKTGSLAPNSLASFYRLCLIAGFLYIFNLIKRYVKKEFIAIPLQIIFFAVFALLLSTYGQSTSRNLLIISVVCFLLLLFKNYSKKGFITTICVVIPMAIAGFLLITILRNTHSRNISNVFKLIFDYYRLNLYFAGPTDVNWSLQMINTTGQYMGFGKFFVDLFANLPFLSSSFFGNDTVSLYNAYIYHESGGSEIIPFASQALIYFGPLLQWLFISFICLLGLLLFDGAIKVKNNAVTFMLAFFGFVLSMGQMISFNAMSMLIVLWPLAFFIVFLLNNLVNQLIGKIKNKKANINQKVAQKVTKIKNNDADKPVIKKHGVGINYIFTLLQRIVLFVSPVIISPFLTKALQGYGLGQYASAFAYISYFTLLANLGFTYYGQREIARCNGNEEKEKKLFWEIFIVRLISTFVSLLIFFTLYGTNVFGNLSSLMLILSINIVSCLFDISFFYQGKQNFVFISIAQSIIKIVDVVLIILLVKNENDLPLYALITACSTLLQALCLWPLFVKQKTKISLKDLKPLKHLLPSLILFLPCITGIVYTSGIKTMVTLLLPNNINIISSTGEVLTYIEGDLENGLFSQSDKIVQMAIAVLTALGSVMATNNALLYKQNKKKDFKNNVIQTTKFVFFLSIPLCLGIIAVSNVLCPWFFVGDSFANIKYVLMSYAPLVIITTLSNVFGLQVLVTTCQDKKFLLSTLFGAITAIVVGIPSIYYLKVYGAVITSIVSELVVLLVSCFYCRKILPLKDIFKNCFRYLIAGIVMFVPIFIFSMNLLPTIPNTIIAILFGGIIYIVVLGLLKENNVRKYLKKIFTFVLGRINTYGV